MERKTTNQAVETEVKKKITFTNTTMPTKKVILTAKKRSTRSQMTKKREIQRSL